MGACAVGVLQGAKMCISTRPRTERECGPKPGFGQHAQHLQRLHIRGARRMHGAIVQSTKTPVRSSAGIPTDSRSACTAFTGL